MSVAVPLAELAQQIERFGPSAYIVTVAADGRPRATSVGVDRDGDLLVVGAGRRTTRNVAANPAVALLWPAPRPGGHALIVDGRATVHDGPAPSGVVVIEPSAAVLHVTAAPPAGDRAAEA